MTRAERRADASAKRRLGRQIAGAGLDTCLIPAGASLAGHRHERRFLDTITDLAQDPRGVVCIVCRSVITAAQPYGAFLLSCAAARPGIATASTICVRCWTPDDLGEIESAATRTLEQIIPGGRFEPLPAHDTS